MSTHLILSLRARARYLLVVTVVVLLHAGCVVLQAQDREPAQITGWSNIAEKLEATKLSQDLKLENSDLIYKEIGDLLGDKSKITSDYASISPADAAILWMGRGSDSYKSARFFEFKKGTTILTVIKETATQRNEVAEVREYQDYIAIRDQSVAATDTPYRVPNDEKEEVKNKEKPISELIWHPMQQPSLFIKDATTESVAESLSKAIREHEAFTHFEGDTEPTLACNIRFQPDAVAPSDRYYIIGNWRYCNVVDAICTARNLCWKISGDTITLQKPSEADKAVLKRERNTIYDRWMSLREILERAIFTETVTIENSSEIYDEIAGLCGNQSRNVVRTHDSSLHGKPFRFGIRIVWSVAAPQQEPKHTFRIEKGRSVMYAIRLIAHYRKDIIRENHYSFVIRPSVTTSGLLISYQARPTAKESQGILKDTKDHVMHAFITLIGTDAESLASFLSRKLNQIVLSDPEFSDETKGVYKVTLDPTAAACAPRLFMIGQWSFRELMDSVCEVSDLRWRIDGNNLCLEKPVPDATRLTLNEISILLKDKLGYKSIASKNDDDLVYDLTGTKDSVPPKLIISCYPDDDGAQDTAERAIGPDEPTLPTIPFVLGDFTRMYGDYKLMTGVGNIRIAVYSTDKKLDLPSVKIKVAKIVEVLQEKLKNPAP